MNPGQRGAARAAFVTVVTLLAAGCHTSAGRPRAAATPSRSSADVSASPTATVTTPTVAVPTLASATPPASPAPGVAAGTCPQVPPRVGPRSDRPRYRLTVDVRPAESVATGTMSVTFTPDLSTDHLVFRLWPNGPVLTSEGAHLTAGPVTVDGAAAAFTLPDPTTMVVALAHPIAPGSSVVAAMPWRLALAGSVRDRIADMGSSARLGTFFPLLPWEPGVGWALDPPTRLFAEATTSPAADFDLTVTVPPGMSALATGVNDRPGHFSATAVPDIGMSVGAFTIATAEVDGGGGTPVSVTVGVAEGLADSPQAYIAKVRDVISSYARRFGPYGWPSFSLAITLGLGVTGIEYPMNVMQGPGTLGRTTSHELGHQWFYGLVGNDQARNPWLDEGLASWAEFGFEHSLPAWVAAVIPLDARGQAGEPMTFWGSHPNSYYRGVYVQTPQALAALGRPDLVDCALRLYVAQYAYRIARPGNLMDVLTQVFPSAPTVLAPFGLHR